MASTPELPQRRGAAALVPRARTHLKGGARLADRADARQLAFDKEAPRRMLREVQDLVLAISVSGMRHSWAAKISSRVCSLAQPRMRAATSSQCCMRLTGV